MRPLALRTASFLAALAVVVALGSGPQYAADGKKKGKSSSGSPSPSPAPTPVPGPSPVNPGNDRCTELRDGLRYLANARAHLRAIGEPLGGKRDDALKAARDASKEILEVFDDWAAPVAGANALPDVPRQPAMDHVRGAIASLEKANKVIISAPAGSGNHREAASREITKSTQILREVLILNTR